MSYVLWKFIEATEMKINQYIAGAIELFRNRIRDTLKQLVNDYENKDRLEYLRDHFPFYEV